MSARGGSGLVRPAGWSLTLVVAGALAFGLVYVFAYVFLAPYPGLDYDNQWRVLAFDAACDIRPAWCAANRDTLREGDQLIAIGDLTHQEYRSDRMYVPFAGYRPGDSVPIAFVRDGVVLHARWQVLGPTDSARLLRLISSLVLFLPFWLAGTIVALFLRPHDTRWHLLIAFNYATAGWVAAGIPSTTQVAASSLALNAISWVLVPVYLHLHLHLFLPTSLLPPSRRYLAALAYAAAAVMALLVLLNIRTPPLNVALLLAIGGSLGLLLLRATRRSAPNVRLAARLMLLGVSLAFGPGLVLWVIPRLLHFDTGGPIPLAAMTLAVPLLPFFYVYALYKHRLGNLEFRANRLLSLYSFLVLYATVFVVIFMIGSQWVEFTAGGLAFALIISLLFVTAALFLRDPFQRLLDRLAYGTEHNPDDILRAFANEIPRAFTREDLTHLLTHKMAPSLLIRESALYEMADGTGALLYADRIEPEPRLADRVKPLLAEAGRYRPAEPDARGLFDWVRLVIPIEARKKLIGVWLLGKRDPDDYYPQPDIELLTTLGGQIGVALETSRLFESLQRRATELERAYRKLQTLDQLKDEFIQNVSHELRTPLTFVRGYVELLLDGGMGELPCEQREALEIVHDRTKGIIRLVNDIITMQRDAVEGLQCEPVDLVALAQSCIQTAQVVAEKYQRNGQICKFVLDTAEHVPDIWGDRRRLGQVYDNLLNNAMKFSPNGGTITIRVWPCQYRFSSPGTDRPLQPAVKVSVSDQGIGIPADKLERIWERFYQVDGSTTRQFGGVGLGLAIVRDIITAHRGEIWAESIKGAGATFHFILPALESAQPPEAFDNLAALC